MSDSPSYVVSWSEVADDDLHLEYRELAAPTQIRAVEELLGGLRSGMIVSDHLGIDRKGSIQLTREEYMAKHNQPQSTEPVHTKEVESNDPNAKPDQAPPVESAPPSLVLPGVTPKSPVPLGSINPPSWDDGNRHYDTGPGPNGETDTTYCSIYERVTGNDAVQITNKAPMFKVG